MGRFLDHFVLHAENETSPTVRSIALLGFLFMFLFLIVVPILLCFSTKHKAGTKTKNAFMAVQAVASSQSMKEPTRTN